MPIRGSLYESKKDILSMWEYFLKIRMHNRIIHDESPSWEKFTTQRRNKNL